MGLPAGVERSPKLLARLVSALAARHYSPRTVEAYVGWVRRYVRFHRLRHPSTIGAAEVSEFLTHLAVRQGVAASTQNQALAALLFLYRHVLQAPLPPIADMVAARRPQRLPSVLTRHEVRQLLGEMRGEARIVALLLYGGGLRLMEGLRVRVKDLDLERAIVTVRAGKGAKDRATVLPRSAVPVLRAHLARGREQHALDCRGGGGHVELPDALRRKLPAASRAWEWQWVFPATRQYVDRDTGERRRHHLHETVVQREVSAAARRLGIPRRVTCHTLRHSFATHLLEDGYTSAPSRNCWAMPTCARR